MSRKILYSGRPMIELDATGGEKGKQADKRFDVLAEGFVSENSRGDRTAIQLFIAGVKGWDTRFRRFLDASADEK
jgi:hypothetical protein